MGTTNRTGLFSRRRSNLAIIAAFLLLFSVLLPSAAMASRGGTEVKNNPFSIGYSFSLGGVEQVCSGAILSPTIIVTAAHCVVDTKGNKSSNYIFAPPGVSMDAPIDPSVSYPKVIRVFTVDGYVLTEANTKDDIAFLQLDKPIVKDGFIRVATSAEISSLNDKAELNGYGFGDVYETNEPYSKYARQYPIQWNQTKFIGNGSEVNSTNSSACSGDSGGPITAKLASGEEVLIAVMSGAAGVVNGCGTPTNGVFTMRVTTVDPYLYLVKSLLNAAAPVASPSPTPSPTKTIAKPITYKITCIKGKTKKYVTGTNPKCPSGYKQTAKIRIS